MCKQGIPGNLEAHQIRRNTKIVSQKQGEISLNREKLIKLQNLQLIQGDLPVRPAICYK